MQLVALLGIAAPAAGLGHHSAQLRKIRLQFRALGIGLAATDGRYVVLGHGYAGPKITLTLLDDRTWRETLTTAGEPRARGPSIRRPLAGWGGCFTASGAQTIPLFSLATGQTRTVTLNRSECSKQASLSGAGCALFIVGAPGLDWVRHRPVSRADAGLVSEPADRQRPDGANPDGRHRA